jgi:hypothetical protein
MKKARGYDSVENLDSERIENREWTYVNIKMFSRFLNNSLKYYNYCK